MKSHRREWLRRTALGLAAAGVGGGTGNSLATASAPPPPSTSRGRAAAAADDHRAEGHADRAARPAAARHRRVPRAVLPAQRRRARDRRGDRRHRRDAGGRRTRPTALEKARTIVVGQERVRLSRVRARAAGAVAGVLPGDRAGLPRRLRQGDGAAALRAARRAGARVGRVRGVSVLSLCRRSSDGAGRPAPGRGRPAGHGATGRSMPGARSGRPRRWRAMAEEFREPLGVPGLQAQGGRARRPTPSARPWSRWPRGSVPAAGCGSTPTAAGGPTTAIRIGKALGNAADGVLRGPGAGPGGDGRGPPGDRAEDEHEHVRDPVRASPEAFRVHPIDVLLCDLHYFGGFAGCQALGPVCDAAGWTMSQHSNNHAGVTMAAMIHLAAVVPQLTMASDTHYPWLVDDADIIEGPEAGDRRGAGWRSPPGPAWAWPSTATSSPAPTRFTTSAACAAATTPP